MSEQEEKLLPCPFCGQTKLSRTVSSQLAGTYQVKCGTINCPGNNGWSQESEWNQRAKSEPEAAADTGEEWGRIAEEHTQELWENKDNSVYEHPELPPVLTLTYTQIKNALLSAIRESHKEQP
jgi:transcription elongation factor Elf1